TRPPLPLAGEGWGEGLLILLLIWDSRAKAPHPPFGHLLPQAGEGNHPTLGTPPAARRGVEGTDQSNPQLRETHLEEDPAFRRDRGRAQPCRRSRGIRPRCLPRRGLPHPIADRRR